MSLSQHKHKEMVNNEDQNQDSWMPETPTRLRTTKVVGVGDPGNGVELGSGFPSKKRKHSGEINKQLPKGTSKKIYRPRIVCEKVKKSEVKNNTPKPSTPKQRRSYVRKGALCKRQLFDDNSSSGSSNKLGIEYNSLQNYHRVTSLLGGCLIEDRRIGPHFPMLFKKKRVARQIVSLLKFLTPFKKGRRSKSFVRKKKHCIHFTVEGSRFMNKTLISRIIKFCSLKKNTRELVPYKKPFTVHVLLDKETSRVWKLLKDGKAHEENDETKKKYWENIREIYRFRVESFIHHMHVIQGDRRFFPWKGSVLDSVVGVFLTQNVADYLSSAAYMSLASKFPVDEKQLEPIEKEIEAQKGNNSFKVDSKKTANNIDSSRDENTNPGSEKKPVVGKKKRKEEEKEKLSEKKVQYWDTLRKLHTTNGHRNNDHMDSVDWEAVRCAKASQVAEAIVSRGQHNIIGGRIQRLLNSLMDSNGSMDLEWLRHAPPQEVKEYLLTIYGLGLKSVECVRLLALHHNAFPVDINVARIVVRLGWVPLQPLPESIQIHNLVMFPNSNKIQQYLWPRLCTLDQPTLYELHYQLITFGKVFCTQKNPNCNACPLKSSCKYFESAIASTKLGLPESASDEPITVTQKLALPESTFNSEVKNCEPIIEFPASPEPDEETEFELKNDEEFDMDGCNNDIEDIPTIKLSNEGTTHNHDYLEDSEHDMNKSTALVVLHANTSNIHVTKMKNVSRLKTERLVYVLPHKHPLLAECTPLERHDPSPYLLVVWTTGELENSCESTKNSLQEEENCLKVPGTLLIPCRTAMRGRFPLNGTYFQVNEVFVDYASMIHPINVPRKWLWNLEKRIVYFGTSVSSIMRGLSLPQIHDCFWKGFVCVKAFDAKTRAPRPISSILHRSTTNKSGKENKNAHADKK